MELITQPVTVIDVQACPRDVKPCLFLLPLVRQKVMFAVPRGVRQLQAVGWWSNSTLAVFHFTSLFPGCPALASPEDLVSCHRWRALLFRLGKHVVLQAWWWWCTHQDTCSQPAADGRQVNHLPKLPQTGVSSSVPASSVIVGSMQSL